MNCQELATAVHHEIPVKVFLMNNGYMGMVRQWQELFWDERYSSVEMGAEPRLGEARRGVRRHGHARRGKAELEEMMRKALETDGPVLVDVRVTPGGELLPDDPRRRRGPGHGGLMEAGNARARQARGPAGRRRADRPQARALDPGREQPGVLARIAGLFARRGFNIDTLAVGPTDDPSISRITLTLDGAVHPIDQVTKQLHKLVNVLKIRDMEPEETIAREMALFKVSAAVENRAEVMQFAEIFRGQDRRHLAADDDDRGDRLGRQDRGLRADDPPHGLVEMVRTGEIAIARGGD